ncbi:ABC transporter substrate-binding protein [Deinococcus yavapaiensis]|uniref:Peptide/nickel transport system substrate-binding protein n=1 Tax=Deinococcus yavapaiensis KR-236 TaxID=694435 RepID=A0A318S5U1_9DEIO|nr:ABC transporter substrate-binding protein [Deinococcus yavapaiensis]PYE54152.1 peptide/nickel transport system substrate-binding protein [Deinococcus yavapaiensis KR-236]
MKRSGTLMLASLALLTGAALAAPKKMPAYTALGVASGKPGGTYTLVLGDNPRSLFYYGAIDSNLQTISNQLFDGLIEYNLQNYKIEPALAESWTVSSDGRVYTFKLRPEAKWSDGRDLTAADVVFTFNQVIMNPEARAGDVANFTIGGEKVKVEALDPNTVRFTLARAAPAFLQQLRTPIMPKHKLLRFSQEGGAKAADINNAWPTDVDASEVVGTGPFKLQSYTPGQKVTLVKNPNYWKVDAKGVKLPYLNTLEYLVIRDPQAQVAAFLAKNVDQLNISGAQFPDLKQREVAGAPFKVVRSPALFGSPPFLAFNFDAKNPDLAKVFSNVRFRRAMQSALNRERIIDQIYNGLASLPGHGVAPISSFYTNTKRFLGSFDLKAAGDALDAMGLKVGAGGQRFIAPGKPLEFDLTYGTDSAVYPPMASIIQNDLKSLGIKVNLKGVLVSTLLSTGQSGNWEAILHAFGDQPDPELRKPIWQPGGALYYWHRSLQPATDGGTPNVAKMFPWEKEIYNIFNQGATVTDPNRRKAVYTRWQIIFAQNLPVIPIAKPENIGVVSNTFTNYIWTLGVIPGYNPVPLISQR